MTLNVAELEQAVADAPLSDIPAVMGVLATLQAKLQLRMLNREPKPPPQGDRMLTAEEASEKLGMTKDYLYRNAKKFPFTVRTAPRQVRFSLNGIERYLKQRSSPY
jgi:predicted DNA-binding transcriptional regulator AlpA